MTERSHCSTRPSRSDWPKITKPALFGSITLQEKPRLSRTCWLHLLGGEIAEMKMTGPQYWGPVSGSAQIVLRNERFDVIEFFDQHFGPLPIHADRAAQTLGH